MTALPITRLERALALEVEPLGDGRVLVTGGAGPHVVDLESATCDCDDFRMRGEEFRLRGAEFACKHLMRTKLAHGDAGLLRAVAELLLNLRQGARAACSVRSGSAT